MEQNQITNNLEETHCRFCKILSELRDVDEYYSQKREGRSGETKSEYSVAIVHETYYDGYYCGRSTYDAGLIRFCPGCGRKMEKN